MLSKKRDLIFIILWPAIASVLSFALNANTFVSTLLFFAVPSAYLSYLNRHCIKMVSVFSLFQTNQRRCSFLSPPYQITGGLRWNKGDQRRLRCNF